MASDEARAYEIAAQDLSGNITDRDRMLSRVVYEKKPYLGPRGMVESALAIARALDADKVATGAAQDFVALLERNRLCIVDADEIQRLRAAIDKIAADDYTGGDWDGDGQAWQNVARRAKGHITQKSHA